MRVCLSNGKEQIQRISGTQKEYYFLVRSLIVQSYDVTVRKSHSLECITRLSECLTGSSFLLLWSTSFEDSLI